MAAVVAVLSVGALGFAALSAAPAAREHSRGLAALACSLAATAAAQAALPEVVLEIVNPLELPWWGLLTLPLLIWPGEMGRYRLICWILGKFYGPLPFRTKNPEVKGHEALDWIDLLYALINGTVFVTPFLGQMARLVLRPLPRTSVAWRLEDAGLFNTVLVVPLMLIIADFYYYFFHRLLHWRPIYPYVHKHHHRQALPHRGFDDAVNEHPFEQLGGMTLLWAAAYTVARLASLHALGMVGFSLALGFLSVVNHTNFDIRLNFVIFEYSVRAHEMHHRIPACNFAQYCNGFDRLLGTYRAYEDGTGKQA